MTLIDRPATVYAINPDRHGDGFRVACWWGPYPTREAADAAAADLNALHESGILEGRGHVLARLRGHGYARLADEIERELDGTEKGSGST